MMKDEGAESIKNRENPYGTDAQCLQSDGDANRMVCGSFGSFSPTCTMRSCIDVCGGTDSIMDSVKTIWYHIRQFTSQIYGRIMEAIAPKDGTDGGALLVDYASCGIGLVHLHMADSLISSDKLLYGWRCRRVSCARVWSSSAPSPGE